MTCTAHTHIYKLKPIHLAQDCKEEKKNTSWLGQTQSCSRVPVSVSIHGHQIFMCFRGVCVSFVSLISLNAFDLWSRVWICTLVNVVKRGLIISNVIHSVTSHYSHIPTPIIVSFLPSLPHIFCTIIFPLLYLYVTTPPLSPHQKKTADKEMTWGYPLCPSSCSFLFPFTFPSLSSQWFYLRTSSIIVPFFEWTSSAF